MNTGHYFISYSSEDTDVADDLCDRLEAEGLQCWIAPRDVETGAYAASIIRAIRSAKGVIFLASQDSAASGHVGRELERAVNSKVPIVPLRLDQTEFSEELEYYLAGMHWLDISDQDLRARIPDLVAQLKAMTAQSQTADAPVAQADDAPSAAPSAGGRRRETGLTHRILNGLLSVPPTIVALGLAFIGVVLTGISALLGVAEFAYLLKVGDQEIAKEVGFLWAPNWALALIVLYPAVAGVGLQALREMSALPSRLSARQMVVEADFREARLGAVEHELMGTIRRGIAVSLCLAVVVTIYAVWEFHKVVGQHYLTGSPYPATISIDDPYQERDWSVAALLTPAPDASGAPGAPISHWANYGFALVVYILLAGFGTSLVLGIFISLLTMAAAAYRLSARSKGLRMVPDVRDPKGRRKFDTRCGFEVFEGLFHRSLIIVVISFSALFCMHLQNLYLRAPEPHILEFALPQLNNLGGILETSFSQGSSETKRSNLTSVIAFGIGSILFAAIVFGLSLTLRIGARQAHALMLARIEDDTQPMPAWLAGVTRDTALKRLDEMRFWPVNWPRLNQVLLAIMIAGLCLVFHKVGVIIMALVMGYLFVHTINGERGGR